MIKVLLLATGGTIACASGVNKPTNPLSNRQNIINEYIVKNAHSYGLKITIQASEKLLDSSEMNINHWLDMAKVIVQSGFNKVIITHGTDTMCFAGAVLSKLLSIYDKKVVITGSQHPMLDENNALVPSTDAFANLQLAMQTIADVNNYHKGVYIAFGDSVLPANNATKLDTFSLNCMKSRCDVSASSQIIDSDIKSRLNTFLLSDNRLIDNKIECITLLPNGINNYTINDNSRAYIFRCYGSGNMSSDGTK